jgi:L-fucose isomerase-like protein
MRAPKALAIPFKFREGYPDSYVDPLFSKSIKFMEDMNIEVVRTEDVSLDSYADLVAQKYNPAEYDFAVLMLPTWFEPMIFVRCARAFFGIPIIVWGYNNFYEDGNRYNLGSTAGAGAAKGTLTELGVPHEYVYSTPGAANDGAIARQIWKVANAGRAISMMKAARILSIGYQFSGMTIGDIDLTRMRSVFGPDAVVADTYTLVNEMGRVDADSAVFKENAEKIKRLTGGTIGHKLDDVASMYTAVMAMVEEYNAQAVTIKCNYELSKEYGLTACIPLSVMGNEMVASCEADIPLVLTQLLMHYLSGGGHTTYGDTHEILEDRVLLAACGFAPAAMCVAARSPASFPPRRRLAWAPRWAIISPTKTG